MRKLNTLSIVVPVYNESHNIRTLYIEIVRTLRPLQLKSYEIIFIDDGSSDNSCSVINSLIEEFEKVVAIKLTRNFGHQYALLAGIKHAKYEACLMLDSDLEHPPSLIPDLVHKWGEGFDVVHTVRRDGDESWIKKKTSKSFYRLMSAITPLKIPAGAADFRLIDKKVIDEISNIHQSYLFLRGYFYWFGFKSCFVEYEKGFHDHAVTSYTFRKMLSLAFSAFTTFSILPLRAAIVIGSIISMFGFVMSLYIAYRYFIVNNIDITSAVISAEILLIGGFIILFLGVIGEYIGRIFIEVKGVPPYVIEEVLTSKNENIT